MVSFLTAGHMILSDMCLKLPFYLMHSHIPCTITVSKSLNNYGSNLPMHTSMANCRAVILFQLLAWRLTSTRLPYTSKARSRSGLSFRFLSITMAWIGAVPVILSRVLTSTPVLITLINSCRVLNFSV